MNTASESSDLLEVAWSVIANAGHPSLGDWTGLHPDWQKAAAAWRDRWLALLARNRAITPGVPVLPADRAAEVIKSSELINRLVSDYAVGVGGRAITDLQTVKPYVIALSVLSAVRAWLVQEFPALAEQTPTPRPVSELCDFIETNAAGIFVRDQGANGRFSAFALSELPAARAIHHALRFIREGRCAPA